MTIGGVEGFHRETAWQGGVWEEVAQKMALGAAELERICNDAVAAHK